jgi:hypothetical protein
MEQGVAPADVARHHGLGRPRGSARRVLRPACKELADDRGKVPGESAARGQKSPRWSAERRAGQRHWPVVPGDPGIGPTARRATGCGVPHQRLSALRSPRIHARVTRRKAYPAPHKKYGWRSYGYGPVGSRVWNVASRPTPPSSPGRPALPHSPPRRSAPRPTTAARFRPRRSSGCRLRPRWRRRRGSGRSPRAG